MEIRLQNNAYITETGFGTLTISSDEQYGFRPYQLMVASIAGCSGTVMKKIFAKKRMKLEDLIIKADVTRNPDQADRIEKIHLTFSVKAEGLDGAQMEKIMKLTRKHCSMVQSVQDAIEITESFEMI
jgi:uncharacterized OsmC-like protein